MMNSKQFRKKNIKSPEKIKVEKLDNKMYTMEHYVGDPVELIKQVFSTLNMKTIKNLSPECLKESKIEEIQELCFNELLGISSKRLKSIINATKCPTDTESSDDDIENIDEHISLEEISSDSDNGKVLGKKLDRTKNGKVNLEAKTKGTNNKEMSVLELLELQARARAIRSQLALEPVAKIEVESDDSNNELDLTTSKSVNTAQLENHIENSSNRSARQSSSVATNAKEKRKTENTVIVNGNGNNLTTTENRPKKIKLKRNFRKRSTDQNTENNINTTNEKCITANKELSASEQNIEKLNENTLKIETERSPSPEVLTIMPNYETLCISDSEDEKVKDNNTKSTDKSPEIYENGIEKPHKSCIDIEKNDVLKKTNEEDIREDFEDGEIVDNNIKGLNNDDDKNSEKNNDNTGEKSDRKIYEDHKSEIGNEIKESENNTLSDTTVKTRKEIDLNDYDHHNDDIISLGDDDLDYDMHYPVDEIEDKLKIVPKIERKSPGKNDELNESADFIELHDSGDENEPNQNQGQSWNTRWLQSKKVSKIMAESKLGNRVRDKRKKIKKAQKEQQQQQQQQEQQLQQQQNLESTNDKLDPKTSTKDDFTSNFEDGSVQQYKEIVDREKNTE